MTCTRGEPWLAPKRLARSKVLQITGKTIQPGAVQLDDLRGWVGVRLFGCDLSDEERQENSKQRAGDHVTAIFSD